MKDWCQQNAREMKFYFDLKQEKYKPDHIMQALQFGYSDQNEYGLILFEKMDYTLKEFFKTSQFKSLQDYDLLKIAKQICLGLSYMHLILENLHRDIKTENVLLKINDIDGNLKIITKLTDFNASKPLSEHYQQEEGTNIGSNKTKSPEVGLGKYDLEADIFSFGVVFHQIFDSQNKFPDGSPQNYKVSENIKQKNPKVAKIIEKCLTYESGAIKQPRPGVNDLLKQIAEQIEEAQFSTCKSEESKVNDDQNQSIKPRPRSNYGSKTFNNEYFTYVKKNQFRRYMKKDANDMRELAESQITQEKLLKESINDIFQKVEYFLQGQKQQFDENIEKFFDKILKEHILPLNGATTISTAELLELTEKIPQLYRYFHEELTLDIGQRIACEFMTGLHVVLRLNIIACGKLFLQSSLFDSNQKEKIDQHLANYEQICQQDHPFMLWESLKELKALIHDIQQTFFMSQNLKLTDKETESKWEHIRDLTFKDFNLNATFQNLCSMRYIPKNKQYLGLAQILHWQGFGGSSNFFNASERCNIKIDKLLEFSDLCIRYHRKETVHFGGEIILENMFIPIIKQVSVYYNAYLNHLSKRSYQHNYEHLTIFDLGSGPDLPAIKLMVQQFPQKRNQLYIIGSDVDATSLHGMQEVVDESWYLDLNDLQGWKDVRSIKLEIIDKVDILTSRLVIHQCADRYLGHEVFKDFFYFAADILKIGGYYFWMDTGPLVYLQAPVIPGNLVDREGGIFSNIYRYIRDLHECCVKYTYEGIEGYKLLIQIPFQYATSPKVFQLYGGIYIFNCYVNLFLTEEEMNGLIRAKSQIEETGDKEFFNYTRELINRLDKQLQSKDPAFAKPRLMDELDELRRKIDSQ